MLYLGIYCALLLALLILYKGVSGILFFRLKHIFDGLENFFYKFHLYIREHKDEIYKYEKSLPVLFAHKQGLFEERRITPAVLRRYIPSLEQDGKFLDELIGIENGFSYTLPHISGSTIFLRHLSEGIRGLLALITLGISTLFIAKSL